MPILSIVKLRHLKAVNPIWFNGDLDWAGCQLVIQSLWSDRRDALTVG
jgi:hypothetical protein